MERRPPVAPINRTNVFGSLQEVSDRLANSLGDLRRDVGGDYADLLLGQGGLEGRHAAAPVPHLGDHAHEILRGRDRAQVRPAVAPRPSVPWQVAQFAPKIA